ncbi:1-phosphofructokinase [Anaerococcus sp.]|uniref:1-phosphofructokinase n=1 Tax=Anaerococcus sp. TaxID=1872515 RepID=UPI002901C65C|nr:1-phosphofructokinase [Anaerococcus sp.]MDU1828965.1 1-phosphofructokinase [Anaerococcus sp.]MDU1864076.1 1-phosphofructokinase [Anaerococcus sp.]
MIYTLTLNPSIDYIMRLYEYKDGFTNRSYEEMKFPGGKGIMVSKLLKNLGEDPINLGFIGGFTGEYIKSSLKDLGIKENFTFIEDDSRINVKLKYLSETEINAGGPFISDEEVNEFLDNISTLNSNDTLIISGSIPKSLDDNFYKQILDCNNVDFTIDVAGKELLDYLSYNPILVKPNIDELEMIFGEKIDKSNLLHYAKRLNDLGAQSVIISMGKDGSIFISEDLILKAEPIEGRLINSVGAGDSMVGGFVYGLKNGLSKKEAYKLAVACGTATAFSEDIAKKELIYEILKRVEVNGYGN